MRTQRSERKLVQLKPRFFKVKIPEEWKYTELGKLLDLLKDGTHNPPDEVETGIPLLTAENIHDGLIDYEKKYWCISKDAYLEMHKKYEIQPNDLLLTIVGTLGRVSQVKDNKRFSVQRSVAILRTNKKILSDFLYHFINSKYFQDQLIARAKSTAQSGIYLEELSKIPIWFPTEHSEQQKIATILSNIDELIQKQQHVIEQTQKLLKGQMQKLLTKGIGHTKFKKEPWLFQTEIEIPVEWEIITLGPYTKHIGSGSTPRGGSRIYKESGIPLIRSQNVQFEGLTFKNMAYITQEIHDEMNRTKLQDFDVLLNITGASIGRCTFLPENFGEGNVNQHVCIIRTKDNLNPEFLSKYLSSHYGQQLILRWQNGGTKEGLNFKQIKSFKIIAPPFPEQQKIASILSNLDLLIQQEKQHKEKLEKIKRGLMQQLLTGQTRVKV